MLYRHYEENGKVNRQQQYKLFRESRDPYWQPETNAEDVTALAEYLCDHIDDFREDINDIFQEGYFCDAGLLVRDLINKVERSIHDEQS
jgi:hypothetical protein